MFKICSKEILAQGIKKITVCAPDIAVKAQAGQFVVIRVDEKGERIPVTIAGSDPAAGNITLIFQEAGKTTLALGALEIGGYIRDVLGPLGNPTEPGNGKTVFVVAGGVGAAEILPVSVMYRKSGNTVIGIIGARNKSLVILEKEMAAACNNLFVTTDDGSYGRKGFVTDVLKELLENGTKACIVYAIGPVPMMRAVSDLTKQYGIQTVVSLNPVMVDGTGMCGACRVTVNGETKFACVDGPEFDGHAVAWEELIKRLGAFSHKESIAVDTYKRQCQCKQQGLK
jgi:ferredoxin/flavodoxin---NADP+ reductase